MSPEPLDLAACTVDTFMPRVGEVFQVQAGDNTGDDPLMEAELIDVVAHGPGPSREQFSLFFRGPADVILAQRTYELRHPALGAFELFLVPIGNDAGGTSYEAVFA